MKKTITGITVLLLILPFLVNAQQRVTLNIKSVIDIAGDPAPNFVPDIGENIFLRYYYDQYSRLTGINNYFYITNTGGAGIINIEIIVDEFIEYKQFNVAGSTSYALVSSVPVWQGVGASMILSIAPPGLSLSREYNGISATGVSATTLDPGSAPRDWYWFDRYGYELWDYENITFGNNTFTVVGNNGKIITSSDGENWEIKNSGTTQDLSGIVFGNGLWAATDWDGSIYTSENTETWIEKTNVSGWLSGIAYGNGKYVAVGGSIYTSEDGNTWSRAGEESYNFSGINYVNNAFIAVGDGIYSSADGTSWEQVLLPPLDTHISGIAFGNGIYMAVGWVWNNNERGDGVVYTSSNGSSWTQQTLDLTGIKGLDKVAFGEGYFIAVGHNGAIIESTDGKTWTLVPSGTANQLTGIAFADGLFVVVGHGAGSLINYSVTHVSINSSALPANFALNQNCPNPFYSRTMISYQLPTTGYVELSIYDLSGRKVITLVNERQLADRYEIEWNANGMNPAIYFCELKTGQGRQVMKIIKL